MPLPISPLPSRLRTNAPCLVKRKRFKRASLRKEHQKMVGQSTATKPSRSDEVLDADEQIKIADQIRAQFDSLAPKRPLKPNRSEPDPDASNFPNPVDSAAIIPELHKFQSLQSQSHGIISAEEFRDVEDEFVETHYYEDLASIDKQHHTTGSGFIKVASEGDEVRDDIQMPGSVVVNGAETQFRGYKSNPATNDWVPNLDEHQVSITSKPNRSESS